MNDEVSGPNQDTQQPILILEAPDLRQTLGCSASGHDPAKLNLPVEPLEFGDRCKKHALHYGEAGDVAARVIQSFYRQKF